MYIPLRTIRKDVPRPPPGVPEVRNKWVFGDVIEGRTVDEWRTEMTTEIFNFTGAIGHWLNVLVARQIAAQAAKLPH